MASIGIQITTNTSISHIAVYFCYSAHLLLHWNIVYGVYFTAIREMKWKLMCVYIHTEAKMHEKNTLKRDYFVCYTFHQLVSLGFWRREDEKDAVNTGFFAVLWSLIY